MLKTILRRCGQAIPTMFLILLVVFAAVRLAPSSPADILLGQHANAAARQAINHQFHLDEPLPVQFWLYLKGVFLHGSLGESYIQRGQSVTSILSAQFPVTVQLAIQAMLFAVVLGLPLGIVAAYYQNTWIDRLAMAFVVALTSVPSFVLGPILVLVLAIKFHLLPVAGWDSPVYTILPTVTLGARTAAQLARFQRAALLDVLSQDYLRTALAKGLTRSRALRKHALRNASLPVLTVLGVNFGNLLTGSFVVETLFHVPGIGYQSIQSINNRDYPVIQGVALLVAAIYVTVNLVTDLLYRAVDPRVRDLESQQN